MERTGGSERRSEVAHREDTETQGGLRGRLADAQGRFRAGADRGRIALANGLRGASTGLRQGGVRGREIIRANPMVSLAAAFGFGLGLARLCRPKARGD